MAKPKKSFGAVTRGADSAAAPTLVSAAAKATPNPMTERTTVPTALLRTVVSLGCRRASAQPREQAVDEVVELLRRDDVMVFDVVAEALRPAVDEAVDLHLVLAPAVLLAAEATFR